MVVSNGQHWSNEHHQDDAQQQERIWVKEWEETIFMHCQIKLPFKVKMDIILQHWNPLNWDGFYNDVSRRMLNPFKQGND